ncbi:hypothetical protein ScPMuIL_011145 [Solemya velum]
MNLSRRIFTLCAVIGILGNHASCTCLSSIMKLGLELDLVPFIADIMATGRGKASPVTPIDVTGTKSAFDTIALGQIIDTMCSKSENRRLVGRVLTECDGVLNITLPSPAIVNNLFDGVCVNMNESGDEPRVQEESIGFVKADNVRGEHLSMAWDAFYSIATDGQQNRMNHPVDNPSDYWRVSLYLRFWTIYYRKWTSDCLRMTPGSMLSTCCRPK